MTELEKRVVNLLHEDAKLDNATIAVMLDKSEDEIKKTVKSLEENGIIVGYRAVVNPEKTQADTVSALIEVKITPQRDRGFDAIARTIYSYPEVKSCYLMSGSFDLMVIVEGENIREVASFVSERLSVLDNVLSCATHFILKRYKQDDNIFADSNDDKRQVVSP